VDFTKYAVSKGITKIKLTGGEPLVRKGIVDLVRMIAAIPGIEDFGMTTNGILLDKFARDLTEAGLQRVNVSLDSMNPQRFAEITRVGNLEDVLRGIDAALEAGLNPVKINCVINNSEDEPNAISVKQFADKKGLQVRFIPLMNLEKGEFGIVHGGDGGNCTICNRLRLTPTGDVKPCLFSNQAYNIREMGIENAFAEALHKKPKSGIANNQNHFYNIGG
jgi:cyclic pyranopterin phosphate synthase